MLKLNNRVKLALSPAQWQSAPALWEKNCAPWHAPYTRLMLSKGLLLATLCLFGAAWVEAAPPKKKPAGKTTKTTKPPEPPADTPKTAPPESTTPLAPATDTASSSAQTPEPARPTDTATSKTATGADASAATKEEVITDFEEEEKKLDRQMGAPPPMPATNGAGGPPGRPSGGAAAPGNMGYKLIVDLLLRWQIGTQQASFYPDHTLVVLMLNVTEQISLQLNVAPDPAFYELAFALTPTFTIKAGKILVPFGTNNFHHIIGGRVDEQSRFLPETWGDYGLAVNHLLIDARSLSLEYDAYVVNGFGGSSAPVIASGTVTDNNFGKGFGGRVVATLPKGIRLMGSAYHSLWNADNTRGALYYSLGAAIPVGAIDLPILNRIGLRGEWSRGELQHLDDNVQQGITKYAVAKAGFFGELTARLHDLVGLRVRAGYLNPDNTVTDINDIAVLEPALIIGTPKLSFIAAYQFTKASDRPYSPTLPNDVAYAKVFLQY